MNEIHMPHCTIIPIPALHDNYIWAVVHTAMQQSIIIDPGDSAPVISFLRHHAYQLIGIFLTHHHSDHTQGVPALLEEFPDTPVWGSAESSLASIHHPIPIPSQIRVSPHFPAYTILKIPGHTLDHIAFWDTENARLFC